MSLFRKRRDGHEYLNGYRVEAWNVVSGTHQFDIAEIRIIHKPKGIRKSKVVLRGFVDLKKINGFQAYLDKVLVFADRGIFLGDDPLSLLHVNKSGDRSYVIEPNSDGSAYDVDGFWWSVELGWMKDSTHLGLVESELLDHLNSHLKVKPIERVQIGKSP